MFQEGLENKETLKMTLNEIFNNENDYVLEHLNVKLRTQRNKDDHTKTI